MAGLKVIATFFDGSEIVDYVKSLEGDDSRLQELTRSVIVIDYRMPRMNGVEAAKVIRELCNDSPAIILTTSDELSRLGLPDDLFDGALHKPFSIADFLDLLRRLSMSKRRAWLRESTDAEEGSLEKPA